MSVHLLVLVVLVAAAAVNAQRCPAGLDGSDATAITTFPQPGCMAQLLSGMSTPVTSCNATAGRDGQPGIVVSVVQGTTQLCDVIQIGATAVPICDGPIGLTGLPGIQGVTGINATLANITVTAVINSTTNATIATVTTISNSTASLVIKNMTAPQGLQGQPGVQGVQGIQGTNGTVGNPGLQGTIPGYIVVGNTVALCTGGGNTNSGYGSICPTFNQTCGCSAAYPLTRAGIQAAINAGFTTCTGSAITCTATVIVGGSVVSDGIPLTIPEFITLDFNGNTFFMAPNASSYDLISVVGSAPGTAIPLLATLSTGNNTVNIAPSQAAAFVAGQMVVLTGGSLQGINPATHTNRPAQQTAVVAAVNSAAGTVTLRDGAAYDFMTSLGATIQVVANPVIGASLKNARLNANGNSGVVSRLLVIENVQTFTLDNIQLSGMLTGSMPASATLDSEHQYRAVGLWVSVAADSLFQRISATGVGGFDTACRDIAFSGLASCTVLNVRSSQSGGAGPAVMFSVWSRFRGFIIKLPQTSGLKIETTAFSQFGSIISVGAQGIMPLTGCGLMLAFGSHHNVIKGVQAFANANMGIGFMGDLDSFNLIEGFSAYNNRNNSIVFGISSAGPVGNALFGGLDGPIYGSSPNFFDTNTLHYVTNPNGHYIQSVSAQTPTASDFIMDGQVLFQISTVGGAGHNDNYLSFYAKALDGILRSGQATGTTLLS